MNSDEKLLNSIYHNCLSTVTLLSRILQKIEDKKLFDLIFDDMLLYREILDKSLKELIDCNMTLTSQKLSDKICVDFTSSLIGYSFSSTSFLAKTLKNSSLEGISDITNHINSSVNTSKSARMLAYELIKTEENLISQMNTLI